MKKQIENIYYALGFPAFAIHEGLHFLFILIFQVKIVEIKYAIFSELDGNFYYYCLKANIEYPNADIKNFTKLFFVAIAPLFALLLLIPFPNLIFYFVLYFKLFWLSEVDFQGAQRAITEIKKRL